MSPTRFIHSSFLTATAVALAACGGSKEETPPDAAAHFDSQPLVMPDAAPTIDAVIPDAAPPDAMAPDAMPGELPGGAIKLTYGATGGGAGQIVKAPDLGFLMPGFLGSGAGFLVRLASDAASAWEVTYPSTRITVAAVQNTAIFLGGTTGQAAWIAKADANGALTWQERLGSTAGVFDLAPDDVSDHVFVLGHGIGPAADTSFELVDLAGDGSITQDAVFSSLDPMTMHQLLLLSDGSYVMVGEQQILNTDGVVVHATASGITWQQRFDVGGDEIITGVAASGADSLCVVGTAKAPGIGTVAHVWAAKLALADGKVTWQKNLAGMMADTAVAVRAQGAGCLLVGTTSSAGLGAGDVLAVELAADGSLLHAKTFGTAAAGELSAGVIPNGTNGYLIGGFTSSGVASFYTVDQSLAETGCSGAGLGLDVPAASLVVTTAVWVPVADTLEWAKFGTVQKSNTTVTPTAKQTLTLSSLCQ